MFGLLVLIVSMLPFVPLIGSHAQAYDGPPVAAILAGALYCLFFLAIIVPSVAVQVRRFHDQDRSGWMVLLNFVPLVGGLIVFVFMFLEGTRGPNRYGADSKAG